MNAERTCPWTKMRQARAKSRSTAALPFSPFWVDYIINIAGFEFSVGTAPAKGCRLALAQTGDHRDLQQVFTGAIWIGGYAPEPLPKFGPIGFEIAPVLDRLLLGVAPASPAGAAGRSDLSSV
jgi:hypothetical protein